MGNLPMRNILPTQQTTNDNNKKKGGLFKVQGQASSTQSIEDAALRHVVRSRKRKKQRSSRDIQPCFTSSSQVIVISNLN